MKIAAVIIFLFSSILFPQNEWEKWEKKETSFEFKKEIKSGPVEKPAKLLGKFFYGLKGAYTYFISDVDGENCPFHPTCSAYFVQALDKRGFWEGSLLFGDRFLRDANIFKRRGAYPLLVTGKLFDPVIN